MPLNICSWTRQVGRVGQPFPVSSMPQFVNQGHILRLLFTIGVPPPGYVAALGEGDLHWDHGMEGRVGVES